MAFIEANKKKIIFEGESPTLVTSSKASSKI